MEAPGTNTSAIYQLRIGSGRTFLVSLKEHTPVIETLRDWSDLPIDESDPYGLTPVSEFQTRAKAHLAQFAGQPWTDILSTDPKAYELKNKITFVTSPDPLRINLYLGIIGNRAQTNALRQKVRKLLAARRARQGIIDPTIEVRHPNGSVTFVNDMEILFQHFDWLDSQPPQELIVTAP
jgi:hypothetical protein